MMKGMQNVIKKYLSFHRNQFTDKLVKMHNKSMERDKDICIE